MDFQSLRLVVDKIFSMSKSNNYLLLELGESNLGDQLQFDFLPVEHQLVLDDLPPESGRLGCQIFVLLGFCVEKGLSVVLEVLLSHVIQNFPQFLMDEDNNVASQLKGSFHRALDDQSKALNSPVVFSHAEHNVPQLFLCSQIIKGRLFGN